MPSCAPRARLTALQVLAAGTDARRPAGAPDRRSRAASSSCRRRSRRAGRRPRPAPRRQSRSRIDRGAVVSGRQALDRARRAHGVPPRAVEPDAGAASAVAARPRYAATTRRVAPHLVRRPGGDHLAELQHDDVVADRSRTSPMSWSTRSIDVPAVGDLRAAAGRARSLSLRVQARGRLVQAQQPRLRREARATPTSLRCPCGELARASPSAIEPRSSSSSARRRRRRSPRRPARESAASATHDGRSAATARFSRTVRSSNSSVLCQVRASPRRARACGGRPRRRRPSSSTRPVAADEAGDRVDEGRLAGAVGPDQPDELALADLEVDVVEGVHAAEAHGQPGGRSSDGRREPGGRRPRAAGRAASGGPAAGASAACWPCAGRAGRRRRRCRPGSG